MTKPEMRALFTTSFMIVIGMICYAYFALQTAHAAEPTYPIQRIGSLGDDYCEVYRLGKSVATGMVAIRCRDGNGGFHVAIAKGQ